MKFYQIQTLLKSLVANFLSSMLCLVAISVGANADPIKIGVSIPLPIEGSIYGAEMRDYFKFANQELASGQYQLIFEDDRCDS